MANVAIINFCNLHCLYCFAEDMIHEKSSTISLDDYRKILEFLSRTPDNHVGIIGGEPTLHPDFDNILKETNKYCKECNTGATLFTNGIKLDQYLPLIGERIGILLNVNSPDHMTSEQWKATNDLLEHLDLLSWIDDTNPERPSKVNLGCNVYPGVTDYSYIWEIVDKYNIHHLRTSVVSPGGIYTDMRKDKDAYYKLMKPIFLEHCKNAIKHKCKLNMDCGRIMPCYFSVEELEIVNEACIDYHDVFCEPVIDIKQDFHAVTCFGQYQTAVDIRDFDTIHELRRYLLANVTFPNAKANCTGKCTTCKKHELLKCAGGCMSFAQHD